MQNEVEDQGATELDIAFIPYRHLTLDGFRE